MIALDTNVLVRFLVEDDARQSAAAAAILLTRAIDAFATGRGDFADYIIREDALAAGCTSIATFDRALLREKSFAQP